MGETELIKRCVDKDPIAWGKFVKRYSALIYWAIQDRLKHWDYLYQPQDIEEIHQNVFLSLWKKDKLQNVKDPKKITAWLVVVAGNEAVDYFRYQKSQTPPCAVSIFEEIAQNGSVTTLADILAGASFSPVTDEESGEIENLVSEELERLLPRQKIIIKLNVLYGKKYREIAEMLNMPAGSVATAIRRIKQCLKNRITGSGRENEPNR